MIGTRLGGLSPQPWKDVTPPVGWTWELPVTIQKRGRRFRARLSGAAFDLWTYAAIAGKAYYVSPSGNDANTGEDAEHPLRKIGTALAKPDVVIVYAAAGYYGVENNLATSGAFNAKAIIATGGQVINSADWEFVSPGYTWTQDGNHFELSIGVKTIGGVFDAANLNSYGDYSKYILMASEAEVDATPGSYFKDGSNVLHVRTLDDRAPDANLHCYQGGTQANCNLQVNDNTAYYFENITFEGCGGRLFRGYAQSATGGGKLYMKGCSFISCTNASYDNANFYGVSEVILERCKSHGGLKDGFNYTAYLGVNVKAIEIDCEAWDLGVSGEGTHQGSTSHAGGTVVRLNGKYHHTHGEGVADVGAATKTWSLGCESYSSICSLATASRSAFYVDTGATTWLDSCYAHDIPSGGFDLYAQSPGDTLHHHNQAGTHQGGTGTIDTY